MVLSMALTPPTYMCSAIKGKVAALIRAARKFERGGWKGKEINLVPLGTVGGKRP
jgi:hypothetical protein